MEKPYEIFKKYIVLILVSYCMVILQRLIECTLIAINYNNPLKLFFYEITGTGYDLLFISAILAILYPIYHLLAKRNKKIANSLFLTFAGIFTLSHFFIVQYFLYQLLPLDIFLFQYSLDEIILTIGTSNVKFLHAIVFVLLLFTALLLSYKYFLNLKFPPKLIGYFKYSLLLSIPVFFVFHFVFSNDLNKFSKNKPLYFYRKSINYFLSRHTEIKNLTSSDIRKFRNLYPSKVFVDKNYPLLHKVDTINPLGRYFNKFDNAPNLVVIIVEGLNDDYMHNYKGAMLMPFLNDLKDKSLYWTKCFTLGERSFAAVPSILGGLPYGEKGFTLLDKLPRHLSLVSIFKANQYFTTFYDGQGSWFHRKGRFFNYNNIDLVFDNIRFSDKYEKIIVGDDNFFWGYHDKDLFNQSLEVIDTINADKRLDIYFTGTSHSPHIISDETYYSEKFKGLINTENADFFNTYKRYIKTVLFVDDALQDFFHNYMQRPDYDNTIFIITGDHPMTEIPIENSLKRYHVPLIIFSEKLKGAKSMTNIVSHLDISGSILSLFKPYLNAVPEVSASLGSNLLVDKSSDNRFLAFMNDNREITDCYDNGYYLTAGQLFKVDGKLGIKPLNDERLKKQVTEKLETFKKTSLYTSVGDKIIPNDIYCEQLNRNLLYSEKNNNELAFEAKFYNMVPEIEITDQEIIFDISFDYTLEKGNRFSLVVQVKDSNDSLVLWSSSSIPHDKNLFQQHIKIPEKLKNNTKLYFQSYFWNQDKSMFTYKNLNILIHSEN